MSQAEKHSWLSLVALGGVFWWFQMRMLDGWSVVDQSARAVFGVYIVTIAIATFAEIAISSVMGLLAKRGAAAKDERDYAIDARANQVAGFFIIAAVNVLVWQVLWEGVMEGHLLPRVDLTNLPTLVFALISILFGGELVKRASTIWLYRTARV